MKASEFRVLATDLGVPLELSDATIEAMLAHHEALYRWNARVNLTAIRSRREGLMRHVLESLFALPFLPSPEHLAGVGTTLVDLGSGNGYPGLPLVIARPDLRGLLIESKQRKADFLRAATRAAGVADRVAVDDNRILDATELVDNIGVVTLRGFPEPAEWISAVASEAPDRCVLAWLSADDGRAIAGRLADLGIDSACHALPTKSDGVLLVKDPA